MVDNSPDLCACGEIASVTHQSFDRGVLMSQTHQCLKCYETDHEKAEAGKIFPAPKRKKG